MDRLINPDLRIPSRAQRTREPYVSRPTNLGTNVHCRGRPRSVRKSSNARFASHGTVSKSTNPADGAHTAPRRGKAKCRVVPGSLRPRVTARGGLFAPGAATSTARSRPDHHYLACRAALRRGLAPRRSLPTVYVSPRAHSVRALLSGLLEDGAECRDARVRRFEAMSRRSQTCARSTRTRGRLHAFTGGQQAPDSHVRPRREKHPPASRTRGHRWRNQTRAAPAPSLRSLP